MRYSGTRKKSKKGIKGTDIAWNTELGKYIKYTMRYVQVRGSKADEFK